MLSALSKRLKDHRLRAGLSRAELSRSSGVDPSYLLRIEQGKATNPPIGTVIKLATALGVTLEDLLLKAVPGRPSRNVVDSRQAQTILELRVHLEKVLKLLEKLSD